MGDQHRNHAVSIEREVAEELRAFFEQNGVPFTRKSLAAEYARRKVREYLIGQTR